VTHRGPVVTALVVVAGLVGFMTANSAGALVEAKPDEKGVEVPAPAGQAQGSQAKPGEKAPERPKEPPKEDKPAPDKPDQPEGPTFPAEAVYTGDATGSDLAVAVAVKGEQASAYLCDGAAVEDWLKGTATGDTVELKSKDGQSTLTAKLDGERLAGEIKLDGQTLPFSIALGEPPTGLYRGENGETTVGWIIMPNGQQVGIASSAGEEAPAPELDPERGFVTIDGQRVDATEITGESTWNN
jgi:hypothetical protein